MNKWAAGDILNADDLNSFFFITKTAGEDISAGDSLFLEDAAVNINKLTISSNDGNQGYIGQNSSSSKIAQKITSLSVSPLRFITARLKKVGSPTDNITISVQADSSGAPSGTALASITIAASELTTSWANYQQQLDNDIVLSSGNTYWIVFERTRALNSSNYFLSSIDNSGSYTNGVYIYSGSWALLNNTSNNCYLILTEGDTETGKIYKTQADTDGYYDEFVGFALADVSNGNSIDIQIKGVITGLSGLTPGAIYYLSNTPGAISTTPGTNTKKAGIAVSDTELLIIQS